jgi:hypothetical protein
MVLRTTILRELLCKGVDRRRHTKVKGYQIRCHHSLSSHRNSYSWVFGAVVSHFNLSDPIAVTSEVMIFMLLLLYYSRCRHNQFAVVEAEVYLAE